MIALLVHNTQDHEYPPPLPGPLPSRYLSDATSNDHTTPFNWKAEKNSKKLVFVEYNCLWEALSTLQESRSGQGMAASPRSLAGRPRAVTLTGAPEVSACPSIPVCLSGSDEHFIYTNPWEGALLATHIADRSSTPSQRVIYHQRRVRALHVSPCARVLACGGDDGNITVWSLAAKADAASRTPTGAFTTADKSMHAEYSYQYHGLGLTPQGIIHRCTTAAARSPFGLATTPLYKHPAAAFDAYSLHPSAVALGTAVGAGHLPMAQGGLEEWILSAGHRMDPGLVILKKHGVKVLHSGVRVGGGVDVNKSLPMLDAIRSISSIQPRTPHSEGAAMSGLKALATPSRRSFAEAACASAWPADEFLSGALPGLEDAEEPLAASMLQYINGEEPSKFLEDSFALQRKNEKPDVIEEGAPLLQLSGHVAAITCVKACTEWGIIVSGDVNGVCLIHDLCSGGLINAVQFGGNHGRPGPRTAGTPRAEKEVQETKAMDGKPLQPYGSVQGGFPSAGAGIADVGVGREGLIVIAAGNQLVLSTLRGEVLKQEATRDDILSVYVSNNSKYALVVMPCVIELRDLASLHVLKVLLPLVSDV